MKRQICSIARVTACASFLVLTIIGISSLVRAMSLETIANENGIPVSWEIASLGNPETITIPGTYWDQRQDDCDDPNRQFEWVMCGYWTKGAMQGLVKDSLGADGLPVPAYTNSDDAWNSTLDVFSKNVTGHDPVQSTDNFYRWFHETEKSKAFKGEAVFTRTGKNTYTYGREGVFPLDSISNFSDDDEATKEHGHNFHFTSHLKIPMKISANGTERFEFSGDDDVWVFLNGKLILDIGGLHEKLNGWFTINQDGTISTYVQNVNDPSVRASLGEPSNDYNSYVNPLNELIMRTYQDKYDTIDIGLKEGDVVNLDFFYAERSTTESNTKITISNMNWPISADSNITSEIVGKIGDTESNLVQNIASITNRDPDHPLDIERLAAYANENTTETHLDGNIENHILEGYVPLDTQTLYYSTTPNDSSSWQPLEISAPSNSASGFTLVTPLTLAPSGTNGDTMYFRYFTETSELSGTLSSQINFYTALGGASGITYDYDKVTYTGKPTLDTPTDPDPEVYTVTVKYVDEAGNELTTAYVEKFDTGTEYLIESPTIDDYTTNDTSISGIVRHEDITHVVVYTKNPDPIIPPTDPEQPSPQPDPGPNQPQPTPPTPSVPNQPSTITSNRRLYPTSNIIGDASSLFLNPLGQVAYVPNTGIITEANLELFEQCFANVVLSQGFVMLTLFVFASSFAVYFSLRRYLQIKSATITRAATSKHKCTKTRKNASSKNTRTKKSTTASKNSSTTKRK